MKSRHVTAHDVASIHQELARIEGILKSMDNPEDALKLIKRAWYCEGAKDAITRVLTNSCRCDECNSLLVDNEDYPVIHF